LDVYWRGVVDPVHSKINRLSVPSARMKETADKLEKLRKTLDTGMDLNYNTAAVGGRLAAAGRGSAPPTGFSPGRSAAHAIDP
jgi:hypothetical protein